MNDETKFLYILKKTGRTFFFDDGGFGGIEKMCSLHF